MKMRDMIPAASRLLAVLIACLPLAVKAQTPSYATDFESSEGYNLGSVDGQQGWGVTQGSAVITNQDASSGSQSVALQPGATRARITRVFTSFSGENIVYVDFYAKPVAEADVTTATIFDIGGARISFQNIGGESWIEGWDGDGQSGGFWTTGFDIPRSLIPLAGNNQSQNWIRLTVRLDFTQKTWDLYVNGTMILADLGFSDNGTTELTSFIATGDAATISELDQLSITTENPLFADINNDGIDDAWELQYGLNLSVNDRYDDPDGDGIPNVFEYANGTDPLDYYNGTLPVIRPLITGSGQLGPQGLVSLLVTDANGYPLASAPLTFSVTSGISQLSAAPGGAGATQISATTNSAGLAQVYASFISGSSDTLVATAQSGSKTKTVPINITSDTAGFFYATDFENTEGYTLGSLDGQQGWSVSQGSAVVTDQSSSSGGQSVVLQPGAMPAKIIRTFSVTTGEDIIYVSFYAQPVAETDATNATTFDIGGARFAFVLNGSGQGALQVFNGDGVGGGGWAPTAFTDPVGDGNQLQDMIHLTVRLDFARKKWDIYASNLGGMVAADLGFRDNTSTYLSSFAVTGDAAAATVVDDILIAPQNPLFADANNDGVHDDTIMDFEAAEGYLLGPLDGQNGWSVTQGSASITNQDASSGTQSVLLQPGAAPASIVQTFPSVAGEGIVYVDFYAKPAVGSSPDDSTDFNISGAEISFGYDGQDHRIQILYGGNGYGAGNWFYLAPSLSLASNHQTQDWIRLTARLDFVHQIWDVYVNGQMLFTSIPFADQTLTAFSSFTVTGSAATASEFDHLQVGATNPLFADVDNDGIDDAWEIAHGLGLFGDRNADPDGDGVSNVQEYTDGTDPTDYYNGNLPVIRPLINSSGQLGPQGLVPVLVTDVYGYPLDNAPLTFSVTDGISQLSATPGGTGATQISVNTNSAGVAQVYVGFISGSFDTLAVTAQSGSQTETIPISINSSAPAFFYATDFENSESYTLGSLDGQQGWSVSQGSAVVTDQSSFSGGQSVVLQPGATPAKIIQTFPATTGENIVYVSFFAKPVAEANVNNATILDVGGARFAFALNGFMAVLQVFDGDGAGGGRWKLTNFTDPAGGGYNQLSDWIHFTVRLDFTHRKWDLYTSNNGGIVAADLGFRDNTSTYLSSLAVTGDARGSTEIDDILIIPQNPLFADMNNDGIDDAWEQQYGLSLAVDDSEGDPDGDGVTNIREYLDGGDPMHFDLDTVIDFEAADGFSPGSLDGQQGWSVLLGSASVENQSAVSGSQSITFQPVTTPVQIVRAFPLLGGESIVYVDFYATPGVNYNNDITTGTTFDIGGARFAFQDQYGDGPAGELYAFSADGKGGGRWLDSGYYSSDIGDPYWGWIRFTIRLDYVHKTWDLYADGKLYLADMNLSDGSTYFSSFTVTAAMPPQNNYGYSTYIDRISITTRNPLFADANNDGIDDAWEQQHGLSLATDDRYLSPNGSRTIVQDYIINSDPSADYYNGTLPVLVSQVDSSGVPGPLGLVSVLVTDSGGTPLARAPLTFAVASGSAQLAATPGGNSSTRATVVTNSSGVAQVYVSFATPAGPATINAIAQSGSQTTSLPINIVPANEASLSAPVNLTATALSSTQVGLGWSAPAVFGESYVIERSIDGVHFTQIMVPDADAVSYIDTGLVAGTNYIYRIRVQGYTGISTPSSAVSVATPPSGTDMPLTPQQGLILWLKADAGISRVNGSGVGVWPDQSGLGNDAVMSPALNNPGNYPYDQTPSDEPTLLADGQNGQPTVHFSTSKHQFFALPNYMMGGDAAGEIFIVVRASSNNPSNGNALYELGGDDYWGYHGAADFYPGQSGLRLWDNFGIFSGYDLGVPPVDLTTFNLYNISASASSWTARLNGSPLTAYGQDWRTGAYSPISTTNNQIDFPPNLFLGGASNGNVGSFDGDIAEVIVYNRILSTSERETVRKYLSLKYALGPQPPVFSPGPGIYSNPFSVTLTPIPPGSTVYYTTDGSDPSPSTSPVYSAPIPVAGLTHIRAIGVQNNQTSDIADGTFNVGLPPVPETPTSGFAGIYYQAANFSGTSLQRLDKAIDFPGSATIPSSTGSAIWTGALTAQFTDSYTFNITSDGKPRLWVGGTLVIDGSSQTSYQKLSGTISLMQGQTYPVRLEYVVHSANSSTERLSLTWQSAVNFGVESIPVWQVASGLAYANTAATPNASPAAGPVTDGTSVTLGTGAPAGAHIYYTLDGSDPTASSALYTAPIVLHSSATLKARASATNYNDSGILVAAYTVDRTPPALSNLTFNGAAVPNPISANGVFGITATSSIGIQRVEFRLDGQLIGTDLTAADGFTVPIAIQPTPDGAHILTIQAWDTLGLASDIFTASINTALPPPAAPVITAPADGTKVNTSSITLRGTAEKNSLVTIYSGATAAGSGQAGADGSFAIGVTLTPGANPFKSTAQNRNPQPSAYSNTVTITYDNTVPNPPSSVAAQTLANGVIRVTWHQPAGGVAASGYYLFRSTSPIPDNAPVIPANAIGGRLQGLTYNDTTPADGHYYYRMVTSYAVGASENLSTLSNQADAVSDSTPPTAVATLQPMGNAFDAVNHHLGQGLVQVTLTASEPLAATPFLNFSIAGGGAIAVNLTPSGNNAYGGTLTIGASTRSGALTPVFSGTDAAGNRGSTVTMDVPWAVDTTGPNATGLTPVQIDSSGTVQDLPVFDVIKNDSAAPVTVSWRLTLDEAPKSGTTPVCTATLSDHSGLTLPVTVANTSDANPLTWLLTLTLPADAGEAQAENLTLAYSVSDGLGNVGSTIVPPHVFQVYQGSLPALDDTHLTLTATAQPAGAVHLTWNAIPGASAYELQVKGPAQSDFQQLAVPNGTATDYLYTPDADGTYSYRVASIRADNGEQSESAWSNVASARSDRVPPDAPTNLSLQVTGQGVLAAWTPPANNFGDVAGYAVYRSAAPITSVDALTPIKNLSDILALATSAVDSAPDGTMPNYALVAFDAAGNRSAIVTGYVNVDLLPVGTLHVAQTDQAAPVLTWQLAPGSKNIDGFNLLIDSALVSVNGSTLISPSTVSYADPAYQSGDRTYTVRTVSGPSSVDRSILLPNVSVSLAPDARIIRGLVSTINVTVQNLSASAITDADLDLVVAGRNHSAANLISLAPGARQTVPVVVGGYADVPSGAVPVSAVLTIVPNDGEQVTLTRSFSVNVAEGAFTAQVTPANLVSGGTGSVTFTLINPSDQPVEFKVAGQNGSQPSAEARIQIMDPAGALLSTTPLKFVLGDDVVLLPDGTTVVRIPAGATYTSPPVQVSIPLDAPATVNVALGIDHVYYDFGEPDTQITLVGPSAVAQASTQVAPYSAEITSINPSTSSGTTPIVIQGRALWHGVDPASPSALAPAVPLSVYIKLSGFVQQDTVTTDLSGNFTYTYQPGAAEKGGVYSVWASHPSVTAPPDNPATFTITSVIVSPQQFNVHVPRNYTQAIPVQISTGPGTTVQNLRAELIGSLPDAVSVTATSLASVGQNQTLTLPLSLTGLAPTANSLDSGELDFNVVSGDPGSEQTWATLKINYQFSAAEPYLQATPGSLQIGAQYGGAINSGAIDLKNTGLAALDTATFSLVSADGITPVPAWIRLGSPATLGGLDVGADFNAIVTVAPPPYTGQTSVQIYNLYLHVQADNATQDIPVSVIVSPSGQGGATFQVVDPYYQLTLPDNAPNPSFNGVPGALVTLQNITSDGIPTVSLSATTDASGMASFGTALDPDNATLPAGSYNLRITSDKHEPYTGYITIQPGVIASQQVALTYAPISFNWSVVPVTLQDTYNITLTATYETQVPVPVVVVEPASITIPPMCAGQVATGEFRITNHGLIDAEQVQINVPASDSNFSYELSSSFGDKIPAGQSVTIPYKITCLKPLPGMCPAASAPGGGGGGGDGGCGTYSTQGGVNYEYHCANGIITKDAVPFYITAAFGNCPPSPPPPAQTGVVGSGHGPPEHMFFPGPGGDTSIPVNAGASDHCFPQPPPCTIQCCDRNAHTGGWVDMTTRQYNDKATDLVVPVPNGQVTVWRDFKYSTADWSYPIWDRNRWHFRTADRISQLSTGPSVFSPIFIADEYYPSPFEGISGNGFILVPSSVTFLKNGVGPEKIIMIAGTNLSTWSYYWTDGQGNARNYDASGNLLSETHYGQLVANYHYDTYNRLTSVTDRDNRAVIILAYSGGNLHPDTVTDFTGRQVGYTYDADGRLSTVTDLSGTITTYTYDNMGELTSERTHLPNTTADQDHLETITYDRFSTTPDKPAGSSTIALTASASGGGGGGGAVGVAAPIQGQVIDVKHNTGEEISFEYHYHSSDQSYYVKTTTKEGVVTESIFDTNGNPTSRIVNGRQVSQSQSNTTTLVETRGAEQTTTTYNAFGNVTRRINPDQTVEAYEYDPTVNKVSKYTNPRGVITTYTYDALGNELTRTEAVGTPLERTTTKTYYPGTNLLQTVTDPLGHQTTYEYDSENNLIHEYDPANITHQTSYTYDALGRKLTMTDALNRTTSYAYDAAGNLVSETDPLQEQTLYTYQGANLIQIETGRTTTAPGRIVRYTYDSHGHRTAEKRVDSQGNETVFKTYAYDNDGRLISETNALGQSTTYAYDGFGNRSIVSQPDDEGGTSSVQTTFDALGRDVQTLDPVGVITQKTYDLRDRVAKLTQAVGTPVERSTSYTYDALGHVLTEKYSDVRQSNRTYTTSYTYDALGRRISTGGDHSYAKTDAYDADDQLTTETDALGRVTIFDYDNYGHVLDVKLNGVVIQSYEYDLVGNRITETDGVGNHVHFHYDALNRLTEQSIPLPVTQAIPDSWWTQPAYVLQAATYTVLGQVASTTRYTVNGSDVRSAVTTDAYDDFGRKISETISGTGGTVNSEPLTVNYSYDSADNLVTVTYPPVASSGSTLPTMENFVRSSYNASLIDAFQDRSGHVSYLAYDEALRVKEVTTSLGGVTDYTFDGLGRIAAQTDPAGTTSYEYDLFDHQAKVTYPDNVTSTHERIQTFVYDNLGELTQQAGAGDYPMTYAYDTVGNRISMTDANNHQTRWSYTPRNQVATKTYADGTSYTYTYDNASRMQTRLDAMSHTTTYAYNAYGLLTGVTYPTDPAIAFTYDQQGRPLSMTDGSGTTIWTYDNLGRMASETQAASHRTLTYSYDAQNNRAGMQVASTDSQSSVPAWLTTYGYDYAGRLQSVLDSRLPAGQPYTYTYAANSNLVAQITTPTGLKETKSFDNLGRLVSISALNSQLSTINSFSYTYDAASQRSTETTPDYQQNFTYDAQRELTQADKSISSQHSTFNYAYDGIGNRLTAGSNDGANLVSTSYTANLVNQYTAVTQTVNSQPSTDNPSYDLNGNTTSLQGMTLRYDEENRLVEASNATNREVYVYDGIGRRVEKDAYSRSSPADSWLLASSILFVYDGRRVIEDLDSNFATFRSYTRGLDLSGSFEGAGGIGGLLAIANFTPGFSTPGSVASYFYDGGGNVVDLIDDNSNVQAHYQYTPFGDRLSATGSLANVNPYQFNGKERDIFGFYYYGLRYYNSDIGRWLCRDPLEEWGGFNVYAIVGNDITNKIDLFGLTDCEKCKRYKSIIENLQNLADKLGRRWMDLLDIRDKLNADFNQDTGFNEDIIAIYQKGNARWRQSFADLYEDYKIDSAVSISSKLLLPERAQDLAGSLKDTLVSAHDQKPLEVTGNLILTSYYAKKLITKKPGIGGGLSLYGGLIINLYKDFGANVYNMAQQQNILDRYNQMLDELGQRQITYQKRADQFKRRYDAEGCKNCPDCPQ